MMSEIFERKEDIQRELKKLRENILELRDNNKDLQSDNYNYFKRFIHVHVNSILSDYLKPIWAFIKDIYIIDKFFTKPVFQFKSSVTSIVVVICVIYYTRYYLDVSLYCTIA